MARGKKTGGRDFKPGNKTGKLGGRPPTPEHIRQAAKLGKTEFQSIFHRFSLMSYDEFLTFFKAGDMTVMERIIAGVMAKAIKGEDRSAALIWDRMMGKITDKVEVKMPAPMVIERPNGSQVVLGHQDKKMIDVTPDKSKEK